MVRVFESDMVRADSALNMSATNPATPRSSRRVLTEMTLVRMFVRPNDWRGVDTLSHALSTVEATRQLMLIFSSSLVILVSPAI